MSIVCRHIWQICKKIYDRFFEIKKFLFNVTFLIIVKIYRYKNPFTIYHTGRQKKNMPIGYFWEK